jgi:hypothetical protein
MVELFLKEIARYDALRGVCGAAAQVVWSMYHLGGLGDQYCGGLNLQGIPSLLW